eukprot:365265-Chlamydomonas_euryale.AAC.3
MAGNRAGHRRAIKTGSTPECQSLPACYCCPARASGVPQLAGLLLLPCRCSRSTTACRPATAALPVLQERHSLPACYCCPAGAPGVLLAPAPLPWPETTTFIKKTKMAL